MASSKKPHACESKKFRIKDFSRHSLASRTRRSAGFQSWIKAEEMSVCSSSSPTYLQDFEHIMNLGETQMTPCPLIPFIPQSKRTRTLYLCLYLCTKTNTHTPLCCFLHHPPSDPRDVGSSEWVSASRVCRLRSWWTLLQPNLSFQDHSIKPTCIYILNRWRMVLMCGKLYLLPTVSTLSLMFWVLSWPLCLEFSHFWPAWCSWNIGFLMFDFSNMTSGRGNVPLA